MRTESKQAGNRQHFLGWEETSTDWEAVIRRPDIDVVDVAVPNVLHAPIAIAAAEAGKIVWCEKPLATSLREAEAMAAAVGSVPNLVWFNYRRIPAVVYAKRLIEEGRLGQASHYRSLYLNQSGSDPAKSNTWRYRRSDAGLGAAGDLLSHSIDSALYLNGPITEVTAMMHSFVPGRDVDDATFVLAHYANGSVGTFEATRFGVGCRNRLNALSQTTGKKYVLTFDGPAGSQNYVNIDLKNAAQQVDFITVDGYNYSGSWVTQTNHASPLLDSKKDPLFGQHLDIDDTVNAYLKAGVPARKYTMGLPLYAAGWSGVPNVNHGLYQNSAGPSAVPLASGAGLCPDLNGATPGCDLLLTPGLATYATLANLTANGYSVYFDVPRVAVSLYDPTSGTFYTYDNPSTAYLKMLYVKLRGLGGAYVWALKDDDANGTMVKTMAAGLKP